MVVISIARTYCYRFCFLFMLLLLVGLFSPSAHADGGAPQLAYVAGAAQGISIIDIARRRVTGSIAVDGKPRTVLLSPDGYALYVTQPTLGRVAVIIAKTGKTLCTASLPGQPSLLALSLDATVLYAAGQGDTSVRALDPMTCTVQQTFETHEPVYGLAVAASTAADATPSTPNQLWITGTTSLTVFEVNGHLLGSVPIAGGPQGICIPGGFTAYVTTRQGAVVAVDLNTRRVVRTLLSGGQFGTMDYDAITGEVYVPDRQHNQLDVLTPIIADTIVAPREPAQILRLSVSILFRCSRAGDLRRADRTHARNAGDQLRDVGTEFCAKLVGVEAVEVRRAEQNGGAHRIGIELEAGDDGCRCQRAVEPGLAVGGAAVAVQLACIIGNCRDGRAICRRKSLSDLRVPRGQRFG